MHPESYELWAVWSNREETAEQCAGRLAATFTGWAEAHDIFSHWNRQGWTRAEADAPFCAMPPRIDELRIIFEKGRAHKDVPRIPWPEMGYSVAAWNGSDAPRDASFHVMPGTYKNNRIFPNSFALHLPKPAPETTDVLNTPVLRKVLLSTVLAWEPAWASVTSRSYSKRFHDRAPVQPFPLFRSGWMTYLSAPYVRRVTPPASAIVEDTENGGMLLLSTNETFTVDNPKHVAVADEIQDALAPLQDEGEKWRQRKQNS
jgi:hypothetical protein